MSKALDKVEENIFKLTSKDIKNNEFLPKAQVYKGFGCFGENKSPELSWSIAPNNTKSFAIVMHDPDAPKENGWYHWLVVNIPSNVHKIEPNGKITGSTETITDFKTAGYNGACPPKGHKAHRYNFTIYALDVEKLNVKETTNPKKVHEEILTHAIAKSTITALFERK